MSDPTREATVAAILHRRFFPGTTHDVGDDDCACETAAVLAALSATPAPLNLLAEWALDDPWEKGDHEFDGEEDFFCVGCGALAPFTYDRDQPNWWKQTPDPQIGHDADCLWVRSRAALERSTP